MAGNPERQKREDLVFAAGGRPWMIVLRGQWARSLDRRIVRFTPFSPVATQFALADRRRAGPALLLTTIGSKTGQRRTVVLPFHRDGDRLVVVGANRGGPRDPHWVGNIRRNPECWVTLAGKQVRATASVAQGDERARIFDAIVPEKPHLPRSQERATGYGRDIPLVLLTPEQPLAPPWMERRLRAWQHRWAKKRGL